MSGSFFLRETNLQGLVQAGNSEVVSQYHELIDRVRTRCGPEVASLFAEPYRPKNDEAGRVLTWRTENDGRAIALSEIDEIARQPIVATLRDRLSRLKPALSDPEIGPTVATWLNIPSQNSIIAVGGSPVLVDWGFLPESVAESRSAREAHFNTTIGRYLPELELPPFSQEEQADYAARLRSNAHRPAAWQQQVKSAASPPTGSAAATKPVVSGAIPEETLDTQRANDRLKVAAIAAAIAAAILLFLAWPGVLKRPDSVDQASLDKERSLLREGNKALEERLKQLRDAGNDRVCRAQDGKLEPLNPGGQQKQDPLPPSPDKTEVRPPGTIAPTNLEAFIESVVVKIVGRVGDDATSQGSGVFVTPTLIVTNRHVVEKVESRSVAISSKSLGKRITGRVIAQSPPDPQEEKDGVNMQRDDFALVQVDLSNHPYAALGPSPAKLQDVIAAGYPGYLGLDDMTIERGIITTKPESDTGVKLLIHSAKIAPGDSGGPLVDLCGRIVGINTLGFHDARSLSATYAAQDTTTLAKYLFANNVKATVNDDADCKPKEIADAKPQEKPPGEK